MGTAALNMPQQGTPNFGPPPGAPEDVSIDAPKQEDPQQKAQEQGLSPELQQALLQVRSIFKEQFAPKRRAFIRRAVRAFEVLKNNPYILFNDNTADFDTLNSIFGGALKANGSEMYQYNDNVYQMLGLAFIAALSPDVPKCRFQPADAQDEEDILVAQKASSIQADNERRNGIKAMQKLELLYLWCTGSYFKYIRNIVDKDRAGVSREPIIEMIPQQVIPNRYVCQNCSGVLNEDDFSPFAFQQQCPDCGQSFSGEDYYEGYSMPIPTKTGETETPNSMTAMNVYNGLNVDADPDAMELYESAILDLEGEMSVAAVRSAYPAVYAQIQQNAQATEASSDDTAKQARQRVTTPGAEKGAVTSTGQGTYSRCWIQSWAFAILERKDLADQLTQLFPDGVKLVTYGELFLDAVPERLTEHWTWCPTMKGVGLYPFGVGDAALDIQQRINDTANTVHAYMDKLAFGTIFYDADKVDWDNITSRPLNPGNGTPINRKQDEGPSTSLEELVYQPEFHIDSKIFEYGPQLIQLAQTIAGVQPQSFGGSDPNVKTMGGQEQALRTAIGRMKLFWDQIREEHASSAECSVRCTIKNMDDKLKITSPSSDVAGDFEQITLLKNELTGDFLAYAESDEGFPSDYEQIQQRIMQLMGMVKDNPFLAAVLTDPDTQKVVSRYLLPENIKLPGDAERSRLKILVKQLAKGQPSVVPGPDGQPMNIPSIPLNGKFDDFGMAQDIFKKWCQENWQQMESNPNGFANVLAALTQASMEVQKQQIAQQLAAQQAEAQKGGGPQGPPPPGAH